MEVKNTYQEKWKARLKEWNAGRDHSKSNADTPTVHTQIKCRQEAQALRAKDEDAQTKLKDFKDVGNGGQFRTPPTTSGFAYCAPEERVLDWHTLYHQERETNAHLQVRITELETANHELRNRLYIAMMELEDLREERAAQKK
jgi:hypothetical protein